MEAARWNQIEELLQAVLDLEPHDRAAFLDKACADDADLRREVDALLAHEGDGDALSQFPALTAVETNGGLWTGRTISHYRIQQRIGAGGMGEVYEARDDRLQRVVALKVLPKEFGNDADRVRRFEQEALSASRLNHPNIITIFEILASDGSQFIAAERIEGQTLRQIMTGDDGKPRKLSVEQALEIAIQIAAALKAAHTAWIIHRDIKPENIMVRGDGLVKVLDFGIAKLNEEPATLPEPVSPPLPSAPNLTIPGAIMGTAIYMSPEQARGEPLDGRTDLYSLGLVFQEMLTAERHPDKGRFDAVPREVGRIIQKLLKSDREERYSSASELLDELQRAKRRLEDRTARRMVGFGALAIIVALAVAGIAAFLSVNETWEERVMRDGHTAAARQAVFSPDGKIVVSCAEDGVVIVWDFAKRERIATITSHPSHKVAYSPDGRWVATGGVDGSVVIWAPGRWKELRRFPGRGTEVAALQFSPDSRFLAALQRGTSTLRRTSDWATIREWEDTGMAHGTFVFSRLLPQLLMTCHHLTVLDLAGGAQHYGPQDIGINWITASPDGRQLAAIDGLGGVWFYQVRAPGDFHNPELVAQRLPAHRDHGRGTAYSGDGLLVATAADDIVLWDARTRKKLARFEYPAIVWSVAFSPDGRWLLSAHGDGAVLIWDVHERELVASLNEHSGGVRAVAFSPDGRRVASGSEDRSVAVWNAATGRREASLSGHTTRVTGVAFSSDGRELASVDQTSLLIRWDMVKRRPRARFTHHPSYPAYCLATSPDGSLFATTSFVRNRSGELLMDFAAKGLGQIYGADFSPDGATLATVTTQGFVILWDMRTRHRIATQELPGTDQISVSISRDGKFMATGEDQGAVRLWSVTPLRELAILGRHGARVKSVAFSPDGKYVASAGDDKMIALWDIDRRKLQARIGTHSSPIYALAFSPDGRQLVSGEHDRTVRLYTRHRTLWGMKLE
jgi:WD40 repeat protein